MNFLNSTMNLGAAFTVFTMFHEIAHATASGQAIDLYNWTNYLADRAANPGIAPYDHGNPHFEHNEFETNRLAAELMVGLGLPLPGVTPTYGW